MRRYLVRVIYMYIYLHVCIYILYVSRHMLSIYIHILRIEPEICPILMLELVPACSWLYSDISARLYLTKHVASLRRMDKYLGD